MTVANHERRGTALLDWYEKHRRHLPWRAAGDPWPVLISEVMLQQTQALRVIPFYERFLAAFPTPGNLAVAPVAVVLALWSGLGYNRRAVRLHEAARRIVREGWPSNAVGLQDLPGIGPYTAAAVACFAFGEQLPTIETNVRRVVSRWHGRPLRGGALIEAARRELPPGRAADWNQGVMDLGAAICRPTGPSCLACPVAAWCAGPATYVAPPGQGRYRGSNREARGVVIRTLVDNGPATMVQLATVTDLSVARLGRALEGLVAEGMIEPADAGVYKLAGSEAARKLARRAFPSTVRMLSG